MLAREEVEGDQEHHHLCLLRALSQLPQLRALTLAAAENGGSVAQRCFLSHTELARLACPSLRRLTADVARRTHGQIRLPEEAPLLESCRLRIGAAVLSINGIYAVNLSATEHPESHFHVRELQLAGFGCAAVHLYDKALSQLPQLEVLDLHNMYLGDGIMSRVAKTAPAVRHLHISGWLQSQVGGGRSFAPLLTREVVRDAVRLQQLLCLQLTVCSRPADAPPRSQPDGGCELNGAGLRIRRRYRANVRLWNALWAQARPGEAPPELILRRLRPRSCA